MTPAPNLQELIATVVADAASTDPLQQLGQAAQTANELEDVTDALLGHFVDRSRQAGRSWSEISTVLGVSKQAAHKRFWTAPPTFERFTPRARAVLADAGEQARALRHPSVGGEELLLALFEPAEALAAQVLRDAGIDRQTVLDRIATGPEGSGPTAGAAVPFSPSAIEVLRGSVQEALQLGHNYVGTEHLLLALFEDDAASALLVAAGGSRQDILRRVSDKLASMTTMPGHL